MRKLQAGVSYEKSLIDKATSSRGIKNQITRNLLRGGQRWLKKPQSNREAGGALQTSTTSRGGGGTSISLSVLTPDLPKSDLYSIFSAVGGVSNQCSGLSKCFEEKKEYNNVSSCLSPYKATKLQEVIN